MRLEILTRFLFSHLRGDTKPLLHVLADSKRVARQPAQARFVETSDLHYLAKPVANARFHGGKLLVDFGSGRLGRRKSRDLSQNQLPVDRLLHGGGHGRRPRLDQTELDERLHIGLRDGFSPDSRQDAVKELLRIQDAGIQHAKRQMQTEHATGPGHHLLNFDLCILHYTRRSERLAEQEVQHPASFA
ncbi:MAG TPA: hypothetical protein VIR54_21245 [Vicinamibacterales bacterium]